MPTATMQALETITFTLNGRRHTVRTHPMKRLLDVLREDCGHTGTKEGCGEGECGACTVLMDGMAVNSCLVPAVQADGTRLLTIEGLAHGRVLSVLQRAFVDLGGAQCGICTPGMLLSAHELITRTEGREPDDDEVREALAGNLCRCTGYQKIVEAVRAAARTVSEDRRRGAAAPKRRGARPQPKRAAAKGAGRRPRPKRAPGKQQGKKTSQSRATRARRAAAPPAKQRVAMKRGVRKATAKRAARKAATKRSAGKTATSRARKRSR